MTTTTIDNQTTVNETLETKLNQLEAGLSLCRLSKRTGLAVPHLSRVFSGKRGLTLKTAKKIGDAVGRTIDEVVTALQTVN